MISEAVYLHYLNAMLDGDKKQCLQIVENLLAEKVCIKDLYLNLFQRSMYRIGQMWEKDRCSITDEHIATKITESMIEITSAHHCCKNYTGKVAVITCVDKEFHELGARMVSGYFDARGWDAIFVGSNSPQSDLLQLINERRPDIVGISNNFYMNTNRLTKLVDQVKAMIPDQEILIGGLASSKCVCFSKYENVHYIASLDELDNYLAQNHAAAENN